MNIELHNRIGSGGFARVYRATDDIGRTLAAKLLTVSAEQIITANEHARALARVDHPNVVRIYGVETVPDPETGDRVQAVVMEFVDGPSLRERAAQTPMRVEELRRVGGEIVEGVEALHLAGVAHQDLHEENVMLGPGGAKVIDAFYRGSLALLSADSRASRLAQDIRALCRVLSYAIRYSELGARPSEDFERTSATATDFDSIRAAFLATVDGPDIEAERKRRVAGVFRSLTERGFVADARYGRALAEQMPPELDEPLLNLVIERDAATQEHVHFFRVVWGRMSGEARSSTLVALADAIDEQVPDGLYGPPLHLLGAFGASGWGGLRITTQLRLEKLVQEDIQLGRVNSRAYGVYLRGKLGTYLRYFWPHFDRNALVEVIAQQLNDNWFTQNYIAENFMSLLPRLAESPEHRRLLIASLRRAVDNGADVVKRKLGKLPGDWRTEIEVSSTVGADDDE